MDSKKIEPSPKILKLPIADYGPMCGRILHEFCLYHNLSADLPVPSVGLPISVSLSRIFDIMLHSMGQEKRDQMIRESNEYLMQIPASLRG